MTVSANEQPPLRTHTAELNGASIGQLTARMSEQVSRLVRDEFALAQLEAKHKAKAFGVGFGMFGASGAVAFFGAGCGLAAGVLGIANVLQPWLAALIVAGGLFVLAGVLALAGRAGVKRGGAPIPTGAVESAKADVAIVRQAVKR
ncbi:MAG TPA: phage holin family protein [Jatrophihabitans sp.]|nr:phage holin family protein [Jatrophihabitans sp.]